MKGANHEFMKEKAAWLQKHMIFYNVGNAATANPADQAANTGGAGGELPIQAFDLRPMPSVRGPGGKKLKAYELHLMADTTAKGPRKTGSSTHSINAYILAWGSLKTYEGTLGMNADYFFTPTVNGCSFAASSNGMAPRVAHSNHANLATQLIDQNRIDADLNVIYGAAGPDLTLKKADYKGATTGTADHMATIVGFRTFAGWAFYYQRYEQDMVFKGPKVGSVLEAAVLNPCTRIT
jgi:hypothetical protein